MQSSPAIAISSLRLFLQHSKEADTAQGVYKPSSNLRRVNTGVGDCHSHSRAAVMYNLECDENRISIAAGDGMLTMHTHGDSSQYSTSRPHDATEQLRIWQTTNPLSEYSRISPQHYFTQVTTSNCERSPPRHVFHGQTQASENVRSSPGINQNQLDTQYHNVHPRVRHKQEDPSHVIDLTRYSPPMSWETDMFPSVDYQDHSGCDGDRFVDLSYPLDYNGVCFMPNDQLSQHLRIREPPTPMDTVVGDEGLQECFSRSYESPFGSFIASNRASEQEEMAPPDDITADNLFEVVSGDGQEEDNILLTPPPESTIISSEPIDQADSEQLLKSLDSIKDDVGEVVNPTKYNDDYCVEPPLVPLTGFESKLDFLYDGWDSSKFHFLDEPNEFAHTFMSDPEDAFLAKQAEVRSAYPALSPGPNTYHLFGTNTRLNSNGLEMLGADVSAIKPGFLPATFQNACPAYENHTFSTQSNLGGQSSNKTSHRSNNKDYLLVDLKRRGYSYKDIKAMGQFEEAESTLRGRYRTLTKPKEARVRKPEWGDREIKLLLQGVAAHTTGLHDQNYANRSTSTMSRRANKIPWKQVAEFMALKGAYKYGNATVKKKWTEIMAAKHGVY